MPPFPDAVAITISVRRTLVSGNWLAADCRLQGPTNVAPVVAAPTAKIAMFVIARKTSRGTALPLMMPTDVIRP